MSSFGISAGYARNRTEITRDVGGFVGRELPNAPRHKANVWVRYRFNEGTLDGLMLAGGVVRVSDRFIGRDNIFIAPAYTRLDASGSYELTSSLKLSVVLQNATNLRYVTSGSGGALYGRRTTQGSRPDHLRLLTSASRPRSRHAATPYPRWSRGWS